MLGEVPNLLVVSSNDTNLRIRKKKKRNNAVKSRKIKLSKLAQILTYQDRKIPCKVREK